MRKLAHLTFFVVFTIALAPSLLLAQAPSSAPALGIVASSLHASVGTAGVSEGTSIYSGDYLSTEENGSLRVQIGSLSIQLGSSSALHIYAAPYGAVVELNRGSVVYKTPGSKQNVVIVASDVRITPDASLPDLGRVSIDDPCEITVQSDSGQANVQSGKESKLIEQGKTYHVRAEKRISYREYLSPDASDYHRYHRHEPCAAPYMTHGKLPPGAMGSHFALTAAALIPPATGVLIWKVLESPDKP